MLISVSCKGWSYRYLSAQAGFRISSYRSLFWGCAVVAKPAFCSMLHAAITASCFLPKILVIGRMVHIKRRFC